MIDEERLRRLVMRVKRIPEAGNGGEALLFLLQAQEQPHAGLRDQNRQEQGLSRSTNAPIISELS